MSYDEEMEKYRKDINSCFAAIEAIKSARKVASNLDDSTHVSLVANESLAVALENFRLWLNEIMANRP